MNNQNIHKNAIGISLPENIIQEIDLARKDVTRSRFILRLIESSMKQDKTA
jgi:metal-responsive CopG/Arc/MetJ family transcriptional regulator